MVQPDNLVIFRGRFLHVCQLGQYEIMILAGKMDSWTAFIQIRMGSLTCHHCVELLDAWVSYSYSSPNHYICHLQLLHMIWYCCFSEHCRDHSQNNRQQWWNLKSKQEQFRSQAVLFLLISDFHKAKITLSLVCKSSIKMDTKLYIWVFTWEETIHPKGIYWRKSENYQLLSLTNASAHAVVETKFKTDICLHHLTCK